MDHFHMPSHLPEAGSSQNQGKKRQHSAQGWESQRPHITRLYSIENRSLAEVRATMKVEYGFEATERQFKRRISQWGLDKNLKDSETRSMAQIQIKRQVFENKDTKFRVRGCSVEPDKISRTIKRKNISDEELLAMPAASTPSGITYYTPAAVDPHSPYGNLSVIASPAPNVSMVANAVYVGPNANTPHGPSQQSFLLSPGYIPVTPLPFGWDAPVTPIPSGTFQTPPGMFQSPSTLWYPGYIDGMHDATPPVTNAEIQDCEIKVARLIELVRKTEENTNVDYVGAMSEVNSLVYDLVTSEYANREAISEERASFLPKCYLCKALEEIGTDDMAKTVESERVLLEAIAICEGRFGEEHCASIHFRWRLLILYDAWGCRFNSVSALLVQLAVVALRKGPTKSESDILSALLNSDDFPDPDHCAWFQDVIQYPVWGTSSRTPSYRLLSTLSIHEDTYRKSPRSLWNIFSASISRRSVQEMGDGVSIGRPILDMILNLGLESVDGPSFFWMATFILAVSRSWESIYNARYLISNAAIAQELPGSNVLKSYMDRFLDGPYRLGGSIEADVSAERLSKNGRSPTAETHTNFDHLKRLEQPLTNLDQLTEVLAEVAIPEIERSCEPETFENFQNFFDVLDIYGILCDAARNGSSFLITLLGKVFDNYTFESSYLLCDVLNLTGRFGEFGLDELPICLAAENGHRSCVEALINVGADVNGGEWSLDADITPIDLAADGGHDDIIRLLIENGASSSRERVLECVVKSLDHSFHEMWLECAISEKDWYSILRVVLLSGNNENYELYEMLSERIRAEFRQIENETGKPTLSVAGSGLGARFGRDLADVLEGEDGNGRGLELLLETVTGVHIEQQARSIFRTVLCKLCVQGGVVQQVEESSGSPILHVLTSRNVPHALGVFLRLEPDINLTDAHNNTALHIAASRNRIACLKLLLGSRINVDAENADGETALQICIRKKHAEAAEEIMKILAASTSPDGNSQVF